MKPIALLALGLALAGTATPALAQAPQPGAGKPAAHARIDANGDGVIDRSEAAANPRMAEHFDRLDANKDGRITADERPQRGMRDGKAGRQGGHMSKLDSNGDGVIDRSEAAANPRMAEHFDKLDANKDGRIAADERPQRGMRDGKGGGQRGERMAQLDTDKDGRFSRDEFAGKQRVLQNFDAIDGNGDGFLTREEMLAYRKAHRGEQSQQK